MVISWDPVAPLTSLSLRSARLCLTLCHRSSSLIIRDTVQGESMMGRAGNIFSGFKEFLPRYVPGTDFAGGLVDIALEGRLGSNSIMGIYRKEYSAPMKLRQMRRRAVCMTARRLQPFSAEKAAHILSEELAVKWLTKSTGVQKCPTPSPQHLPK